MGLGSDALTGLAFEGNRIMTALRHLPDALSLIGNIWLSIKQWNVVLGLLGLGVIFYFLRGNREQRIDIMLPVSMLLGFLVIIIFHYQNLHWQIGTAWNRLTLQSIPIFILVVMKHPIQIFSGGYKP